MTQKKSKNTSIYFITITALMTALVYVFTAFINIRLPIAANGGLIHLGNVPLFIGAILFGRRVGAIAGGVGMALFPALGLDGMGAVYARNCWSDGLCRRLDRRAQA